MTHNTPCRKTTAVIHLKEIMNIKIDLTPEQVQALLNADAGDDYNVSEYSDAMLVIADAFIDWQTEQEGAAGLFADCGKYE